jgi:hypothetical protein
MSKKLTKKNKKRELMSGISQLKSPYDRSHVEKEGLAELKKVNSGEKEPCNDNDNPVIRLMTLYEFDNSSLLTLGFQELYRTFATSLCKDIQQEYDCKSASEKTTARLVAQNYVRTLEIQKEIALILKRESYNDLTMKRYSILSKEYDRANRQYLMSLQTLQSIKQPPISVSVKAHTANIANQQLVQENTNVKPK